MIQIVICDDDTDFLERIQEPINHYFQDKGETATLQFFHSGTDLLLKMNEMIDLFLLDIDMPSMNGIDIASIIRKSYPNVPLIFISNAIGMVFDVFRVSPLRFVRKEHLEKDLPDALSAFYSLYSASNQDAYINLSSKSGEQMSLQLKEIIYFNSEKHYVAINCRTSKIMVREKLDYYEQLIHRDSFIRVGKSYLVNLKYADRLLEQDLLLKTGVRIPISRAFLPSVKQGYMRYIRKLQQ